MAIQDSNADRRNLTLLSLSIIIYFCAGGELTDPTLKLPLVNIEFSKPNVLQYFLWSSLVWFAFRYWLTNRTDWKEKLYDELTNLPEKFSASFIKKRFDEEYKIKYSGDIKEHHFKIAKANDNKSIKFQYFYLPRRNSVPSNNEEIPIRKFKDKAFLYYLKFCIAFTQPTLSGYFAPYILFVAAIFLGIIDLCAIDPITAKSAP